MPKFTDSLAASLPANSADAIPKAAVAAPPKADAAPDPKPVAQAAPDKPAATPDPDDEILSGKRSPKTDDFKRVKASRDAAAKERDEFKNKVVTYEQELTELRKSPKHNAELIKSLEKERDEFRGRYEAVTLEMKPEFHKEYADRVAATLETVKALVPAEVAPKLVRLLQFPDGEEKRRALAELTEDLDQFSVGEIVAANREVQRTLSEKQAKLAAAHQTLSTIGEERQKQMQARQEAASKAFDGLLARRQSKDEKEGHPAFQLLEGDSDEVKQHNAEVAERIAIAKVGYSGKFASDEDRADFALQAAAVPKLASMLKSAHAENAQLRATLAKLQGGGPQANGGGGGDRGGNKKSFTDRMMAVTQG